MARVDIENLRKTFKGPGKRIVRAVDGLTLGIEDGELLALVGPSGCGKTTTLRLVAGLEEPDSGTLAMAGKTLNGVRAKERDVAMVFQNQALYPHMSVYENMAFGLKLRKLPRAEIRTRVGEAAALLDLADCLEARPHELSGGQRQRVALGRAVVRRPRLFLLDEPLSHLDPQMRGQMRVEIARLHTRLGATMIYVTHDQVEAMTLGQRIAVMRRGALQQVGAPLDIYRHPANQFVAGFIGSPAMNLIPGTLVDREDGLFFQADAVNAAASLSLRLPAALAARIQERRPRRAIFGIRPENITCATTPSSSQADCSIEAAVEMAQPTGAETFVHFLASALSFVARFQGMENPRPGDRAQLRLDMSCAHFFDAENGQALV